VSGYVLRLNDEPADAPLPRRNELKEFAMIIPAYMNKERQRGRGGRPLQRSGELNQFDVMRSPFNMTLPLRFQLRKRLRFGLPTLANRHVRCGEADLHRRDGVGRAREGGKMAQVTQSVANESESQ
jgi:hypothetical protein